MNIQTRLAKLEATVVVDSEPIQFAVFFVPADYEPIGYTCDGVKIIREPGESNEVFHKRCREAVIWPNKSFSRHHFSPIR